VSRPLGGGAGRVGELSAVVGAARAKHSAVSWVFYIGPFTAVLGYLTFVARMRRTYDFRGCAMLRQLGKEVSDCYAQAEECARKAAEATTDQARIDYLRLHQHWLTLARSYELGERLVNFSKENARRRAEFYGHDIPVRAPDCRQTSHPASTIPCHDRLRSPVTR
jgi:hypothetical protein